MISQLLAKDTPNETIIKTATPAAISPPTKPSRAAHGTTVHGFIMFAIPITNNKAINIVSPSHDGAWPAGNAVSGVTQTTTPVTTHKIPIKKPRAAKILTKTAKTSPTLPIRSAIFSLNHAIARSPATMRIAGAN